MKYIRYFLLFILTIFSALSYAQKVTPKSIEVDLDSLYTPIRNSLSTTNIISDAHGDSIKRVNDKFQIALKRYTARYSFTLTQHFDSLTKGDFSMRISTSEDKQLRIYSWECWTEAEATGYNVIQYKYRNKLSSGSLVDSSYPVYDNGDRLDQETMIYSKIYTLNTSGKTYYLVITNTFSPDGTNCYQGIKVLNIDNGILNDNVKLIKTKTGIKNEVGVNYDGHQVYGGNERPYKLITYDSTTQTIHIAVVDENGKPQKGIINYTFTGNYFEKVKSTKGSGIF
jgi:hypothetical protein